MKMILKVIGWIFIPYIMIFVFWKELSRGWRIAASIYSAIFLFDFVHGYTGGNTGAVASQPVTNSTSTTDSSTVKTPTNQASTSNTDAQKKAKEAAAEKQKADQQAADQKQQKAELDAEVRNAKSYQDKIKALRDYINIDKSDLLAKYPNVQDMGFAGDLFIQTNKYTLKYFSSVGDQLISQQANGIYWEVEVTLNNAGSNPILINTDMFTLTSSDGRQFSTDTKAEMMISKPIIMDTLNPDVDDTGYLIFDVPQELGVSNVMLNIQNGFNNVKLKIS